jgi:hypothetical protein
VPGVRDATTARVAFPAPGHAHRLQPAGVAVHHGVSERA